MNGLRIFLHHLEVHCRAEEYSDPCLPDMPCDEDERDDAGYTLKKEHPVTEESESAGVILGRERNVDSIDCMEIQ